MGYDVIRFEATLETSLEVDNLLSQQVKKPGSKTEHILLHLQNTRQNCMKTAEAYERQKGDCGTKQERAIVSLLNLSHRLLLLPYIEGLDTHLFVHKVRQFVNDFAPRVTSASE